jgi:hypothetical protein
MMARGSGSTRRGTFETTETRGTVTDADAKTQLEAVVRGVATAGKTLKLYPPTSPIPREAAESAADALEAYLGDNAVLALAVDREGFRWMGEQLGIGVAGAADLSDELRDRGVAEVDFTPGVTTDELVTFLQVVAKDPDEIKAAGGVGALLVAEGVQNVRVTDVQLTIIEEDILAPDEDIEAFLRQLANDPDRLSTWLAAASAGDSKAFAEGLGELASVVGPDGMPRLMESLSIAFMAQQQDGKDALLALAMDDGTVQALAEGMFRHLGADDIAGSVCDGLFGDNMLSLSNALTHLPLQERMRQVYDQVQTMLAEGEHSGKEMHFLEHMMDVRSRVEPESALVDTDAMYSRIASGVHLQEEEIARLRGETQESMDHMGPATVTTMLALLDQQSDLELYSSAADNLAAMVPRLIEQGDVQLADRVVSELSGRREQGRLPWPEADARLGAALQSALSERATRALVKTALDDRSLVPTARDMIRKGGDVAMEPLIEEAVALKADGIEVAEEILGPRLTEQLVVMAPRAQWYQVGPIVERLAKEGDARSMEAVQAALQRDDEQSRREATQGVAAAGGAGAARLLAERVNDDSTEVAIIAVKAMGKYNVQGSAKVLSDRFESIDPDDKDFLLAREIISALARLDDPDAVATLKKIAGRKALIKRGHFVDIQALAKQGLEMQSKRGGAR